VYHPHRVFEILLAALGALFDYHPALTNATVVVEDANHPSTSALPTRWQVQDEMYNFRSDPRGLGAVVLLSADETSYIGALVHLFAI
jgi:Trehalose utilisation